MSDSLTVYLHDHLAGANYAVEVLEFLRDQGEPHSGAASALLAEIEEDRAVLRRIADTVGDNVSTVKEVTAWIGEKFSEFKLSKGGFGIFQAWEIVALGIQGKLALWDALDLVSDKKPALKQFDLDSLKARAEDQHRRAESARLDAAKAALG